MNTLICSHCGQAIPSDSGRGDTPVRCPGCAAELPTRSQPGDAADPEGTAAWLPENDVQPPPSEEVPGGSSEVEAILDSLLARWEENRSPPEELCREHPELLEEIRRRVRALQSLGAWVSERTIDHVPPRSDTTETVRIPGYEILGELGKGGMGVVYKARQLRLNRLVAIKMILSGGYHNSDERTRFFAEAEAVARLGHPHIVQIFEVSEVEGRPFFSLEFLEAGSLNDRLRETLLAPRDAAALLEKLALGVQHAHERGIVHRDLKPHNVLLAADGTPRITDFGLAKFADANSELTRTGQVMGTPAYMAPEQAEGKTKEVGPGADVYALGAILYRCLTGRPPFQGPTIRETLRLVVEDDPVPPRKLQPSIPRDLETICLKCLRKPVEKRYHSAQELAEDLHRYQDGQPIRARRVGTLERTVKWVRRRPLVASLWAAGVLCLALLGVGGWYRAQVEAATLQAENANKLAEKNQELANTEKYYSALNRLRGRMMARQEGWSWEGLKTLADVAYFKKRDLVELRSLVADCHSRFDIRLRQVNPNFDAGAIAFSPDGQRVAFGEGRHALAPRIHVYDPATGKRVAGYSFLTAGDSWTNMALFARGAAIHDGVSVLAFSRDGRWLAAGTRLGRIHCWDTKKEEAKPISWEAWPPPTTEKDFKEPHGISSLAFSPDGKSLFSCSYHRQEAVKRWDLSHPGQEASIPDRMPTRHLAVSPDGRWLVVSFRNQHTYWLDSCTLQAKKKWTTAPNMVFSPDGRFLVTAAEAEGEIRFRDVRTGEAVCHVLSDREKVKMDPIHRVSLTTDHSLLVSWNEDQVQLWDVVSGRLVKSFRVTQRGKMNMQAAISPDGRTLAVTGDHKTYLYEIRRSEVSRIVAFSGAPIRAMDLSSDGKTIMCVTEGIDSDCNKVVVARATCWDISTNQATRESLVAKMDGFGPRDPLERLAACWHPQGDLLSWSSSFFGPELLSQRHGYRDTFPVKVSEGPDSLVIQEDRIQYDRENPQVQVRDDPLASNGRALRLTPGSKPAKISLRVFDFPVDQYPKRFPSWDFLVRFIVRVERQGKVNPGAAWEAGMDHFDKLRVARTELEVIPDDGYHSHICTAIGYGWSKAYPALEIFLQLPNEAVQGVVAVWVDAIHLVPTSSVGLRMWHMAPLTFSPDGETLWGVVDQQRVVSWRVADRRLRTHWSNATMQALAGAGSSWIHSLAAGRTWIVVGTGHGEVVLIDPRVGTPLNRFMGLPHDAVRSVALSPAEDAVLAGTVQGNLRVLQLPNGKVLTELKPHTQSIESLAFSPATGLLATGSRDRSVRLWRWKGDELTEILRLEDLSGPVQEVRLSANGKRLAVLVEGERAVRIWELDRLQTHLAPLWLEGEDLG